MWLIISFERHATGGEMRKGDDRNRNSKIKGGD